MTIKNIYSIVFVLLCQCILGQNDSITKIKEVVVSDLYQKTNDKTQSVLVLNDSVIKKNQSSLTDLLNYNSTIYFKQYGRGMLSTVSFRGTTAAQTAVVWNGININSQLTGSTDFNTVLSSDFNSISIKAGGGSVIYGSGAIGGTVHLNNDLLFKNQFENTFRIHYGSFNSISANYSVSLSNKRWSTQIGISHNSSDNDYPYVGLYTFRGVQRKNENGQYQNQNLNANAGYKFNKNNLLKFYSQFSDNARNLSLVSEAETKTKYENNFTRSLLEYTNQNDKLTSSIKAAYVTEIYKYFGNINSDFYSFGKSEAWIGKLDLGYDCNKSVKLNAIVDYNRTKGFGSSFGNNTREISSAALIAKTQFTDKWTNDFGIRKEATDNYQSPFLFSLGSAYSFSKLYTLKVNGSRNYRIPTFNDLYWIGAMDYGNPNLRPESSYQGEIGNVFNFKRINFSQTIYFNDIKDLINWKPGNETGGWSPQNTNRVNTYGTETLIGWRYNFGQHYFNINSTYAYTISKNVETRKQLFFVPFHKATAAVSYSFRKWETNYQFLYNGFVYTRSDNDPKDIIKAYMVSNIGISYDFGFFKASKLGFQVLNLLNEKYQSLEDRPLPGINFNINITLKF